MNSVLVALSAFIGFILAYRFYGRFLSRRIFGIDPARLTPAHEFEDGIDFVPSKKHILFGHHFTSIAGAAPIVGPAIAVIWGWLPALLWVVLGSIFMGAVHDFGALVVSARHKGKSIGEVTRELIGPRARTLFLLLIFFALLIVIAVFGLVIAVLFKSYPATVIPIWFEVPIAITLGFYIYRRSGNTLLASIIAVSLMYLFVYIGTIIPIKIPAFIMGNEILTWVVILLVYAYIASILPVWVLLQPRDYINSHQLFVGLGLMYLGLFIARPEMVAPAINQNPAGAPMLIPFLFITIACGAISGFHSLVSSGTTVKQIDNEKDMRAIGYGAMLWEGVLATMAILACTAGFASTAAWNKHYASWNTAKGLGAKVGAFVEGGASFLSALGFSHTLGAAIVAVLVISFAATTLDSATRIQRYVVAELAEDYGFNLLRNRHPATMVAVISAFLLSMINGGKGGLIMWPLFGTVNQLLAGLALLAITMYLVRLKKPVYYTLLPMIFILTMTGWAMLINLWRFISKGDWLLVTLGACIFILEIWLVLEAVVVLKSLRMETETTEGVDIYPLREEE
ncbi:MAG: carbon starvation protein A [Thermodesulfobacteriota bacterium]